MRDKITDEELRQWAKTRVDDAGHLARELIEYRRADRSGLKAMFDAVPTPAPETHTAAPDAATVARHMKDFQSFVSKTAPKLHWKVYQDLGADPGRSNGYYDGWQMGFGEALFGPLPLPQLMEEMKASVAAKVRSLATTEGQP